MSSPKDAPSSAEAHKAGPPLLTCAHDTVRDSVLIVAAYLVVIFTVQERQPNWGKLLRFFLVFVPVVTLLRFHNEGISSSLVNGAGVAMGNHLFELLSSP
jgi:hypothetical protein